MTLQLMPSPDGKVIIGLHAGFNPHGLDVINLASWEAVQRIPMKSAWFGLGFSPDGKTLYASGGNADSRQNPQRAPIYAYSYANGKLSPEPTQRFEETIPLNKILWAGLVHHPTNGKLYAANRGTGNEPGHLVVFDAASGKLLGIGHTVLYQNDKVVPDRPRSTSYSTYDPATRQWTPWTTLQMPADQPDFFNSGAGCSQRLDLENGDSLLPIYCKAKGAPYYSVTVLRCRFDGATLTSLEHGPALTLESGRGVYEPSLTRFKDTFYLTLRNDTAAYLATSTDGLHYTPIKPWTFDDGTELGSYNTQAHWVTHRDSLWLAYTRRGAHNDHVVRHRAPLFIAQVDPKTLTVLKKTETILVPERGARLGNFAVTEVSENETWVTVAEWMHTHAPHIIIPPENAFGADNSIYTARLRWHPKP
jgi:hypothetical protein